MEYSRTKDIIEQGGLLSNSDLSFIKDNINIIQDNWEKRQVFRTETEMRVSVLNDVKFPTPASKYWQCIREQAVFYEQLVQLSFEYKRNKIKQKQLKAKIAIDFQDQFEKELLEVDLEELQFAQLNMEQIAKDRMREIRLWQQLMVELDDGSFDTQDVNTHQLLSYGLRFERQMENIGNASPAELSNLVGQFQTTLKYLQEKGLVKLTQKGDQVYVKICTSK